MCVNSRLLSLCLSIIITTVFFSMPSARSQTFELGTNLDGVTDFSTQVPFLNLFRMSREWHTQNATTFDTGESERLNLDADGWLRSLNPIGGGAANFTQACTLIFSMGAVAGGPEDGKFPYPPGAYVVRYDGEGILNYSLAGRKNFAASVPGRDVIDVTPMEPGIQICVSQTDPANTGNYIRNIQVFAPGNETSVNENIFDPAFLTRLKPFGTLRFMDWMHTNNSAQINIEDMPRVGAATWTTSAGVPAEIIAKLANTLSTKPWFNMPHRATDGYVAEFATIVRNTLDPKLDIYVEYSNEIWNDQFSQGQFIGD